MIENRQSESHTHHTSGEQIRNSSRGSGMLRDARGDIDLIDLWGVMVKNRKLIGAMFLAALLVAISYAYVIPPVYRSSIHFLPPQQQNVNALNATELNAPYTVEAVFQKFQNNFKARSNLWKFFNEKQLYTAYLDSDSITNVSIYKAFDKVFIPALRLETVSGSGGVSVYATLEWRAAEEGAVLLNEYSQKILAETAEEFINELKGLRVDRMDKNAREIAALRKAGDEKIKWQLAGIEENIRIAKSLGLKRPANLSPEQAFAFLVGGSYPLYYSGYEALELQEKIIINRKDNDPFTPGLENMIEKQAYLQSVRIPEEGIQVARISLQATAPSSPIKPKKKLIVVFGAILGLFLGIMAALLAHLMTKPAV